MRKDYKNDRLIRPTMHFKLPLPPSINRTYKTNRMGRFYKAAEAKDWEEVAGYEIIRQQVSKFMAGPVYVGITMHLSKDRDIDGSIKIILDLLQKQSIYTNDSQVEHLTVKKVKCAKTFEMCEIDVEAII